MPTWILSLDASTPATVVAVGRVDESAPRAEVVSIARANQTSERLTDHIHGCLTRAGITPAKLAYVACGVGPGIFTGTRVTVARSPTPPIQPGIQCRVDSPPERYHTCGELEETTSAARLLRYRLCMR